MTTRQSFLAALAIAAGLTTTVVAVRAQTPAEVVLTNVSYDPTRELSAEEAADRVVALVLERSRAE